MRLATLLCAILLLSACSDDESAVPESGQELIVFSSKAPGNDEDFEIYTMRPDGSDLRQLTRNEVTDTRDARDAHPLWSPNGRQIAFMSSRDNPRGGVTSDEVYVMDADGSNQRRLTNNRLADLLTGWTTDGEVVFWHCRESIAGCDLRVIEPDGSRERTVFETSEVVLSSVGPYRGKVYATIIDRDARTLEDGPAFAIDVESGASRRVQTQGIPSPAGSRLLIVSDEDENGPCLFHDCWGHAPELYADDVRLTHSTGYDVEPAWSPGGKRIVFARIANDDGDDYELWMMNQNGTCETQITDNGDWDVSPDWRGLPESDHPLDC